MTARWYKAPLSPEIRAILANPEHKQEFMEQICSGKTDIEVTGQKFRRVAGYRGPPSPPESRDIHENSAFTEIWNAIKNWFRKLK